MAVALMLVYFIVQMALWLFFLIWLWIVRVRGAKRSVLDKQEWLLWLAAISFTLGVAMGFYFNLAPRDPLGPHAHLPVYASFCLGCIGVVLALLGKGRGRIVTGIACSGLAILWLPIILP